LSNTDLRAACIDRAIARSKYAARSRPLESGPKRALRGRKVWRSRHLRQRSGRGVEALRPDRHV